MRYPRLFITRGLPGSGKSTVARETLAEHLAQLIAAKSEALNLSLVSRDDLRRMFHGRRLGWARQEQLVTAAQEATITALLAAGSDVLVHDTNLPDSAVARFDKLARDAGARLEVIDLRDVPMDECLRRDRARACGACIGLPKPTPSCTSATCQRVGDDVIRGMYDRNIGNARRTARVARAAGAARARA